MNSADLDLTPCFHSADRILLGSSHTRWQWREPSRISTVLLPSRTSVVLDFCTCTHNLETTLSLIKQGFIYSLTALEIEAPPPFKYTWPWRERWRMKHVFLQVIKSQLCILACMFYKCIQWVLLHAFPCVISSTSLGNLTWTIVFIFYCKRKLLLFCWSNKSEWESEWPFCYWQKRNKNKEGAFCFFYIS